MISTSHNTNLIAVMNTIVDGVILIDHRGIIQLYNPACVKIFGYSSDEVIGENVSLLMPEPDRSHHDDYIKSYQSSGDAKIIGIGREVKGRRKSGDIFPMNLSVGELAGPSSSGFVGIIRDLSEETRRAAAFDELQQDHFHLSRVSAMDQMGAAIAHELNQPLTAIMNYLEAGMAVLNKQEDKANSHLVTILKKSSDQASRAAQILGRLRQFIETGDVEKNIISVDYTVKNALALVGPSFKNKGIEFLVEIPDSLPNILANSVQIQQVLVNLIRNACEAMENSQEKKLRLSAGLAMNDRIEIKVTDTGTGLSEDAFENLFRPFNSTKTTGLGVGLSICKSIIDNHDGQLWAERNNPNGTHFIISIPVGR